MWSSFVCNRPYGFHILHHSVKHPNDYDEEHRAVRSAA